MTHSLYYFLNKVITIENTEVIRTKVKALQKSSAILPNKKFILWWSPTINRSSVYVGKKSLDLTGITMYGKLSSLKIRYVHLFRNHIWEGIYQKCKEYFPDYISGNKMIPNYYYSSFNDDERIGNILEIEREEKIKLNFKIIWTDYDSKEIEVL
ncbi:hypothetical protein H312_03097, partial [Anncaliia algerae PRA339]